MSWRGLGNQQMFDGKYTPNCIKWNKTISILRDYFCEKEAFFYLPPECKFGYNAPQDIPICPARYFNQILLNFNQYFASDADYIFFARSVYEQDHLRSSINFAMHKTKLGTLSPGTAKSNFKGTIKRLVPSANKFSLINIH